MYLTNPFLFRKTLRLAVSQLAVNIAAQTGSVSYNRKVVAGVEPVLVGAQAAGLRKASRVAATTQSVAISGPATNLKAGRVLTAAAASVSAGTQDAFLQRSRINGMTKAEIDIAGQSAALLVGRRLFAGQADVVVQPFSVGMLKVAGMLDADLTALDIASPGAALRKHSLLLPSVAGFDIGVPSTRLLKGFKVSAEPQSYAAGGQTSLLGKHSKVFATPRSYAIATPAATLTYVQLLAYVTSSTSIGATITIPATSQTGDIAVLCDYLVQTGSPTVVTPTGWTNLATAAEGSNSSNRSRAVMSYRVLQAGDAGTSVTGMAAKVHYGGKIMLVFRGTGASVTPSTWGNQWTGGNPTLQTVSASGQASPLVVFGLVCAGDQPAAFSTASPSFDATFTEGAGNNLRVGYKIYNSAPADHSIDANDLGNWNNLMSGYLLVA